MKVFSWDQQKNELLRTSRGVGFEEVIIAISEGMILDVLEHPNKEKFGHQKVFIIEINQYAYLVPFVENELEVFLKTIIPSRKATRKYKITTKGGI